MILCMNTNFFTQNLETFSALTFLSDGNQILIHANRYMFHLFKNKVL